MHIYIPSTKSAAIEWAPAQFGRSACVRSTCMCLVDVPHGCAPCGPCRVKEPQPPNPARANPAVSSANCSHVDPGSFSVFSSAFPSLDWQTNNPEQLRYWSGSAQWCRWRGLWKGALEVSLLAHTHCRAHFPPLYSSDVDQENIELGVMYEVIHRVIPLCVFFFNS